MKINSIHTPLVERIVRAITKDIEKGALKKGKRLPSTTRPAIILKFPRI